MYAQAAEIRSDFAQIAANAAAYNAPGCGQFGGPGVPHFQWDWEPAHYILCTADPPPCSGYNFFMDFWGNMHRKQACHSGQTVGPQSNVGEQLSRVLLVNN